MQSPYEDRWLTEQEASELLLSTRENVRRMVWSGRLAGERISGAPGYRISERSVRRLLEDGGYAPA
jgi:excisionase family DNA binding protein